MLRLRRRPVLLLLALASLLAPLSAHAAAPAFDAVAETEKLLATLPAEARDRSDAYFEGTYWLLLWNLVAALVAAGLLLLTGLAARIRTWAERVFKKRFLQVAACVLVLLALDAVIRLPLDYYEGYVREHTYGLSNHTLGGLARDWLVSQIAGAVLTTPLLVLLYAVLRRWPLVWWSRAALATPFLLVVLMAISPVFLAPLFNSYRPLADASLREPILSLARANGIPADDVWQFDASKQTKRISANVSGALGTTRIALNDNLLNRCTPAEIRAVMAHEMGHYVLNHTYKMAIFFGLVIAAGFAFTAWSIGFVLRRYGAAWGLRGLDDPAGLPLLTGLLAVYFFATTPGTKSIIRLQESEADLFGLNAAREPDGFATTALKLGEYRKLAPGPLEEILFFDHPSGRTRVLMAMRWKAEHPELLSHP